MERTILLVDDDVNVTSAIRRTVRKGNEAWKLVSFNSTDATLEYMAQNPVHLLLSDIRMPGKNGFHLLKTVAREYPSTVRIIFSGHYEEENVMDSVCFAHQFLAKPVNANTLREEIDFICYLQELLHNQSLEQEIGGLMTLQTAPDNFMELLRVLQSPEPSIKRIAVLINKDLALTARIMQVVNSAFFGLPHRASNSEQAVMMLGVDNLRNLLLSVKIFQLFEGGSVPAKLVERLWLHSSKVAGIARAIATYEDFPDKKVDECMLAAMLHDIGKMVLLKLPAYRAELARQLQKTDAKELNMERMLVGTTHAEAGGYLIGIWGLERAVVDAVIHHHCPSRSRGKNAISPLTMVHVANYLVNKSLPPSIHATTELDLEYLQNLGLENHVTEWEEIARKANQDKGGQSL